jgi:hypothetical protein
VAVSETATLATSSDVTDTAATVVSEASTSDVSSSVSDTTAIAVSESSDVSQGEAVKNASDDAAVAVTEATSELAASSDVADSTAVAVSDTTDLARDIPDTIVLGLTESALVTAIISAIDNAAVAVSESVTELAATSNVTDSLVLVVTEALSTGVFLQPTDSIDLSVQDDVTSPLLVMLSRVDDGQVAVTEVAAIDVIHQVNDSCVLSIDELADVVTAAGQINIDVSDSLAVVIMESVLRAGPWITPTDRVQVIDGDRIQVIDGNRIQVVESGGRIQ